MSAAVSKILVAPIERVKLLLQVQDASKTNPVDQRYNFFADYKKKLFIQNLYYAHVVTNVADIISNPLDTHDDSC